MKEGNILITAPALNAEKNVSGVSSVASFIINNNMECKYRHFQLGRNDDETEKLAALLRLIKTYFKWASVLLFGKISLVHFNVALSKASIIRDAPLVIFAKLLRKKIIIHLHGGDYLFSKQAPGWMRFLLKRVFAGNIPVLVLSNDEVKAVKEKYGATNIYVLPNCVDLKDAEVYKRKYDIKEIKLLFIGRVSQTKGLDFIYSALDYLKKNNYKFKFLMAGTGPQEKEYLQKFSSLLDSEFEFKGVVSGKSKTELYQSCDVFLLPSLFEGLPMSLLEAMSFGLAPVVTDVGSISTVVINGQNGIITPLNDNTGVETAKGVEALLKDEMLLKQLSEKASETIFKNFSPQVYINNLNKIYTAA